MIAVTFLSGRPGEDRGCCERRSYILNTLLSSESAEKLLERILFSKVCRYSAEILNWQVIL